MASALEDDRYTPAQVDKYLRHISFLTDRFPRQLKPGESNPTAAVDYLSALQRYQMAAVPFENLSLHYSRERVISLDKDELYEKIVGRENKRGGYCMENNKFFGTMLKSMGFDVIFAGARVCGSDGNFGGWSHQVSLVIIAGTTYLVDVGFGGQGSTRPIPLENNCIRSWGSTEAANRLIYQEPSHPILQGQWTLQHRVSENHDWATLYMFHLIGFLPGDFDIMNYATSTKPTSFFTYQLVCVKMIIDEKVDDIVGVLVFQDGIVKRRIGAVTEDLMQCKTEEERVGALKRYFGIKLSKGEVEGIRRTVAELKPEK